MAACLPCCGSWGGPECRRASHAGSWYPEDAADLRGSLRALLERAAAEARGAAACPRPKAIIAPHAGLRHCGRTAAFAYAPVLAAPPSRVVLLGPSHHKRVRGCSLPPRGLAAYDTPLGRLELDLESLEELRDTGDFGEFTAGEDEAEHSIEMQLPFTALCTEPEGCSLVPIFAGQLSMEDCCAYAAHLEDLFDDPDTLFVVSSDFCHWGAKFRYQPRLEATFGQQSPVPGMGASGADNPVNAGIEALDLRGIELVRRQNLDAFSSYLEAEGNTICGRNPIRLLLKLLSDRPGSYSVRFPHYSQSRLLGPDPGPRDSSVSYAAGVCEPVHR